MKVVDLFLLAINNLKRRKFRTVLTVLGVVIGTSSIVVMVSLGLGMSESLMQSFKNSGSLTKINISNYGGMADNTGKKAAVQLTDDSLKQLETIMSPVFPPPWRCRLPQNSEPMRPTTAFEGFPRHIFPR